MAADMAPFEWTKCECECFVNWDADDELPVSVSVLMEQEMDSALRGD